ncbi:MAG TPA: cellulase N-terminal Ig-like domain-containing protein, partial [Candidatus Acidoferrum sp.]
MKSAQVINKSSNPMNLLFGLVAVISALVWPASTLAQSSFVRVHQTGYVSSAPKRAYLMTSSASTGSSFSVVSSGGTIAYSAALGADQGKWGTFAHVYALDFDSVSTAGTYTISVSGAITATSPS